MVPMGVYAKILWPQLSGSNTPVVFLRSHGPGLTTIEPGRTEEAHPLSVWCHRDGEIGLLQRTS